MTNPLLQKSNLPQFDKILPKHFKPALVKKLKITRVKIKNLLVQKKYTWNNFVAPLDIIHDQLSFVWGIISHLNSINGTKSVRAAYKKCLPLITKYVAEVSQDTRIYQAIKQITKKHEYKLLDSVQKKILQDKLRDFRLAGVALPTQKKHRFIKLKQKLADLGNKFAYNVVDSSQNYSMLLSKKQTQGLPEQALILGSNNAKKKNLKGWRFTLDFPSYHALITYANSRSVRKKIFTAYVTRASEIDPTNKKWDNTKIIEEILKIRSELAQTLSFKNFAEYSLATKMAKTPKNVLNFLHDLAKKTFLVGKKELKELQQFAYKYGIKKLQPWDLAYYEEKLAQEKFKLSQEELRPYFPLTHVLKEMFRIVRRLYGITIKEKKGVVAWHQDVRFFEIYDHQHQLQGCFYLDPFCRENKLSGAWLADQQTRYVLKNGRVRIPIAYLVCNFSPPIAYTPSLLTHQEVLTLFHEFGHGLQHLLTKVKYIEAAGTKGIPWDAVEFASQFMENWGWQKESIKLISQHYKTKKHLPPKLRQNLFISHTYHAAMQMLRQLEFALIDFNLHLKSPAPKMQQIKKIVKKVQNQIRVTPVYKYAKILHTFLHIFSSDSYAAGYYSYKWAEVLSADAFTKFEEHGIFDRKTGKEFLQSILETGGSENPMVLFKKFRGREPRVDALLQHCGINKIR